jgi:hypothetical protein
LGRKLSPNEVVHHKNEDYTDDRIENLEVMTRSEHMKLHRTGRRFKRPEFTVCAGCGEEFETPRTGALKRYCTLRCYHDSR